MVSISGSALDTLRQDFGGDLLVAGDAGYDEGRSLWNGDIDRRPAVIACATSTADVAAAIRFAARARPRAGGARRRAQLRRPRRRRRRPHARTSAACATSRRSRRPPRRAAVGGTTWADLDAATQAHGQAVPGGQVSHTGVAGLTLGGGIGWLTKKAGLSCDNLVSARRRHRRRTTWSPHPLRRTPTFTGRCAVEAATSAWSPSSSSRRTTSARS